MSSKNIAFCCRCVLILRGQLAELDAGEAEVSTGSKQVVAPDFSGAEADDMSFQEYIDALSPSERRKRYYDLEMREGL